MLTTSLLQGLTIKKSNTPHKLSQKKAGIFIKGTHLAIIIFKVSIIQSFHDFKK